MKRIRNFILAFVTAFQFAACNFTSIRSYAKDTDNYDRCYVMTGCSFSYDDADMVEAIVRDNVLYVPIDSEISTNIGLEISHDFGVSENVFNRAKKVSNVVNNSLNEYCKIIAQLCGKNDINENMFETQAVNVLDSMLSYIDKKLKNICKVQKQGTDLCYFLNENSSEIYVFNGKKMIVEKFENEVFAADDENGENRLWVPLKNFLEYMNADYCVYDGTILVTEYAELDIREFVNSDELYYYKYDIVNDACYDENCYESYNVYSGLKNMCKKFLTVGMFEAVGEIGGKIQEDECQDLAEMLCTRSSAEEAAFSKYFNENAGDLSSTVYSVVKESFDNNLKDYKKSMLDSDYEKIFTKDEIASIVKETGKKCGAGNLSDSLCNEFAESITELRKDPDIQKAFEETAKSKYDVFSKTNIKGEIMGLELNIIATTFDSMMTVSKLDSGEKAYCEAYRDFFKAYSDIHDEEEVLNAKKCVEELEEKYGQSYFYDLQCIEKLEEKYGKNYFYDLRCIEDSYYLQWIEELEEKHGKNYFYKLHDQENKEILKKYKEANELLTGTEVRKNISEMVDIMYGEKANAVKDVGDKYLKLCMDITLDQVKENIQTKITGASITYYGMGVNIAGYAADFIEFGLNKLSGFTDYNVALRYLVYLSYLEDNTYDMISNLDTLKYGIDKQEEWKKIRNYAFCFARTSDISLREAAIAYKARSKVKGYNFLENSSRADRLADEAVNIEQIILNSSLPGEKIGNVITIPLTETGCVFQKVSVSVFDEETGEPISDAKIKFAGDNLVCSMTTDKNGVAVSDKGVCMLPVGNSYDLSISAMGYAKYPGKDYENAVKNISVNCREICDIGRIDLKKTFSVTITDKEENKFYSCYNGDFYYSFESVLPYFEYEPESYREQQDRLNNYFAEIRDSGNMANGDDANNYQPAERIATENLISQYGKFSQTVHSYELKSMTERYCSIFVDEYNYGGGTHGYEAKSGHFIDLERGCVVSLDELFINTDDLRAYTAGYFYNKYSSVYSELMFWNRDQLYKCFYDGKGTNWFIEDDMLCVNYGSYELGSYAAGHQLLKMPLSECRDYWTDYAEELFGDTVK